MSAGAVTTVVITSRIGEKNIAIAKHTAIIIDVNPVLPPTDIPADEYTLLAGVEFPKTAPIIPAVESESNARPKFGILLSYISPAWLLSAINAPAVSKKATNKKVKITAINSGVKISCKFKNTTPNV